jgi:hypothetical protein
MLIWKESITSGYHPAKDIIFSYGDHGREENR